MEEKIKSRFPDLYVHSSEIEHNKVLLALLHYIISHVEAERKVFIDGYDYGIERLGLVAMFAAEEYEQKIVYTNKSQDVTVMCNFQKQMKHPEDVYNKIQSISNRLLKITSYEFQELIKTKRKRFAKCDKNIMNSPTKAAWFFCLKCLMPEYWDDTKRLKKKDASGKEYISKDYNWSLEALRPHIDNLSRITREDFFTYAEALQTIEFTNILGKESKNAIYKSQKLWKKKPLLYLDLPKIMKEYERYDFGAKDTLYWLNFIENFYLEEGMYFILTFQEYRMTQKMELEYAQLYTKNDIVKEKMLLREVKEVTTEKLTKEKIVTTYKENITPKGVMKKIKEWEKKIPIYRVTYRNSKQYNNYMCFYTNIPVKDIENAAFARTYLGLETMSGKFEVKKSSIE